MPLKTIEALYICWGDHLDIGLTSSSVGNINNSSEVQRFSGLTGSGWWQGNRYGCNRCASTNFGLADKLMHLVSCPRIIILFGSIKLPWAPWNHPHLVQPYGNSWSDGTWEALIRLFKDEFLGGRCTSTYFGPLDEWIHMVEGPGFVPSRHFLVPLMNLPDSSNSWFGNISLRYMGGAHLMIERSFVFLWDKCTRIIVVPLYKLMHCYPCPIPLVILGRLGLPWAPWGIILILSKPTENSGLGDTYCRYKGDPYLMLQSSFEILYSKVLHYLHFIPGS